ncbi:hypothetical protein NX794_08210 [Streptomyces sp. LP11]|uniref:Uncharacterized protein n=1 Tax=Streptomyces pyxinicus TaxID=2970331 RepID=A0ABT2AY96_9ACTN|nr:hypothetical protein [Streptomyces sp. LP11]MCS0601214.1 hypothetical protein [Streptomyces sp. LP11]
MSTHRNPLCRGPYGEDGTRSDGPDCSDPAVFEVTRHHRPALRVCPVHLGPSLLLATAVLWPPEIRLVGRASAPSA